MIGRLGEKKRLFEITRSHLWLTQIWRDNVRTDTPQRGNWVPLGKGAFGMGGHEMGKMKRKLVRTLQSEWENSLLHLDDINGNQRL